MNDKELKYRKSIEEFIFVAESSTEIICDIITNELSLNEHYKEKTEVRLRNALEVFFKNNRIYYPDNNMFEGKIVFNPEMMHDLTANEFTYNGVTYKEDFSDYDETPTNTYRLAHEQYLREKYHTDRFDYMKSETNIVELFQDEQFLRNYTPKLMERARSETKT